MGETRARAGYKKKNGELMKRARGKGEASCDADGLSPSERVCSLLRDVQWKTNCSTLTLQFLLDALRGRLGEAIKQCHASGGLPLKVTAADKKMTSTVCIYLFTLIVN